MLIHDQINYKESEEFKDINFIALHGRPILLTLNWSLRLSEAAREKLEIRLRPRRILLGLFNPSTPANVF